MKNLTFKGYNNYPLYANLYDNVKDPVGVVQIIHGMQEHIGRYENFCNYLNAHGYVVFLNDLRGHGKTRTINQPWGYSEGDISRENIEDQKIISKFLKEKYNLPLTVLGHSYGSFIAQIYLIECDIANKIIFSGSTYTKSFAVRLAKIMADTIKFFKGKKASARNIEKLTVKGYGKNFENGNWLSGDESVWKKYNNDEMCGQNFPVNFYCSMFKLFLYNYKNIKTVKKNTPIFIFSGSMDPVSNKAKNVNKLYKFYKNNGFKVRYKIYPNGRHEMLNDLNKTEVYYDILKFLNSKFK